MFHPAIPIGLAKSKAVLIPKLPTNGGLQSHALSHLMDCPRGCDIRPAITSLQEEIHYRHQGRSVLASLSPHTTMTLLAAPLFAFNADKQCCVTGPQLPSTEEEAPVLDTSRSSLSSKSYRTRHARLEPQVDHCFHGPNPRRDSISSQSKDSRCSWVCQTRCTCHFTSCSIMPCSSLRSQYLTHPHMTNISGTKVGVARIPATKSFTAGRRGRGATLRNLPCFFFDIQCPSRTNFPLSSNLH